jgi:EAL domain-containing protein (putative c-di-GMP-specific phosphodiesterase class I)
VLSLAGPLAGAQRAIVFDEDRILAGIPGTREGNALQRLFARARRVLEDELVTPELYVARMAPDRSERLALRWRSPGGGSLEVARAIVASCAWALEGRGNVLAPADLPDGTATLRRLEQLVHDARRMKRSFAVVFVDVEPPRPHDAPARDAVARSLRREVRANDHLGHLGGDAFLALLALESGESEAYPAAQRLLRAAAGADATANVGVAICPDDGVLPDELVEKASAAAMAAASVGGMQPFWYRESAGRSFEERALVRARLSDGDPATLFDLRYQPVFDGETGALWGASTGLTWRAPSAAPPPLAYLSGEPDRAAREALERWAIGSAAGAYHAWRTAGIELRMHLALATRGDAAVDALAESFGTGDAMRHVWVELAAQHDEPPAEAGAFARRVRALGANVGTGAWRVSLEGGGGALDFVTVADTADDVRALAALALGSVVAPVVIASGAADRERARWLVRHGATAVRGEGLAEPMGLQELVRWASDHTGPLGL